eukprot:GHVU01016322.1.p1 GENE.GHVU01016322.1~~GHVU01016322.1.p1  ORF type:complete len:699 (-),score=119.34 GHVU01016322.1:569-2638(-)
MPDDHLFVPPGGVFDDPEFPAVAITTKALLANAVAGSEEVCLLMDGTFKLHDKNWVLLIVGVESLKFDRGAMRHQFRPICMCMAVSECFETYRVLLRSAAEGARLLFGKSFTAKWALSDHCDAAQNAAASLFPGIRPLTCWPHVARNAKKKGVLDIVAGLHRCTAPKQFDALHRRVVEGMKERRSDGKDAGAPDTAGRECVAPAKTGGSATPKEGAQLSTAHGERVTEGDREETGREGQRESRREGEVEENQKETEKEKGKEKEKGRELSAAGTGDRTFTSEQIRLVETTYGDSRWRGWYRGASGVPGVTPNNNSIERFNRMFKDEYLHLGLRLCLAVLLTAKLPYALAAASIERGSSVPHSREGGQVTSAMVRRAWRVKAHPQYYDLCGHELFLDATPHQMQRMTPSRLVAYKRGLDGRVDEGVHWSKLVAHHLYVVCVTFIGVREDPYIPQQDKGPGTPPGGQPQSDGMNGNVDVYMLDPPVAPAQLTGEQVPSFVATSEAVEEALEEACADTDDDVEAVEEALEEACADTDDDVDAPTRTDAATGSGEIPSGEEGEVDGQELLPYPPETDSPELTDCEDDGGAALDKATDSALGEPVSVNATVRATVGVLNDCTTGGQVANMTQFVCTCYDFWQQKACYHVVLHQALKGWRTFFAVFFMAAEAVLTFCSSDLCFGAATFTISITHT